MKSYFGSDEFSCKCGCGDKVMDDAFMVKLNLARHTSNIPYIINSGKRCLKHNKSVGGSPDSSHLRGLAADIKADDFRTRFKIMLGLLHTGFSRIGISKKFLHVDSDPAKDPNVIWLY